MTRIAHIADLHLGHRHLNKMTADGRRNQREEDFERAALSACEAIIDEKVDLVIIAGDMLDKTSVSTSALDGAFEFISRLSEKNIPVVVIGGNHDHAESDTSTSDLTLLRRFGAHVYLAQGSLDIAGLRLHLVPFRTLSRAQRGSGQIEPFKINPLTANVLVAHGYAEGEDIPSNPMGEEVEVPAEWLRDPRFSLCCLGHIHHQTQLTETAFFSGSPERRNFGERTETPGFWIHELLEDGELIDSRAVLIGDLNPSLPRPMEQHEIDASEMTTDQVNEAVGKIIDDESVYGAMVRIVLRNVSAELDRRGAQKAWQETFIGRGGLELDITTQTREVSELLDVEFAAAPKKLDEAFAEFVSAQEYDDDEEKAEMGKLAALVMAEAHEKLLKLDGE